MVKRVEGKKHTVGDGTTESSGKGEPDLLEPQDWLGEIRIESGQEEEEMKRQKERRKQCRC